MPHSKAQGWCHIQLSEVSPGADQPALWVGCDQGCDIHIDLELGAGLRRWIRCEELFKRRAFKELLQHEACTWSQFWQMPTPSYTSIDFHGISTVSGHAPFWPRPAQKTELRESSTWPSSCQGCAQCQSHPTAMTRWKTDTFVSNLAGDGHGHLVFLIGKAGEWMQHYRCLGGLETCH